MAFGILELRAILLRHPVQKQFPPSSKRGTRNSELPGPNFQGATQALDRLKLTVSYDGGPFSGWQSQPNRNGIQDHLASAFSRILESQVKVFGAGRTDAGVHALGQVAHVDVPEGKLSNLTWIAALNSCLPAQIRVLKCTNVSSKFHARYSAKGKVYLYRIWNNKVLPPLEIGRAWHVPGPIDADALQKASRCVVGRHDFGSFAANRGTPEESTIRTVYGISIRQRQSLLTLEFRGDGFLYRMVRMLTASLVQVALGRKDLSWIEELIRHPGLTKTNHTAPAEGLYLVRVLY